MRYLILALLAAFSLSVTAGKPSKEQITSERAAQGADACDVGGDAQGTKRQQQSAQKSQECRTFNESRSNNSRGAGKAVEGVAVEKPGGAGIAVNDPGVPGDRATGARK